MKRYITFVLVAMSLVGLVACSNDNGIAAPDGEAQVALRFESNSMTRATVDGDTDLNENLIKTIDCYFYPANADEYDDAVWYQQFDFVDEDNGIAGKQSTAKVTDILMPSDKITAIFGTGTTGKIYAIANYAGGDALPTSGEGTSVAELKEMVVTTAWLDNGAFKEQSSFVMDSDMVEITKSDNTISGEVPLFRTAAKVELTITGVAASATDAEKNVWVPNITVDDKGVVTGAYVTMYNARTTSSVGGAVQDFIDGTHPELTGYGFSTSTVAGALYKQTNPFYTYPHAWTSSEQEAYLLLVVNWKKQSDNNTTANCYYEIPIGVADNKEILRNHIYQIGINVGTLGSFVKEDPVLLTPSYMVVDWGTGDISAQIKDQQYLVVDETNVEIFNQNVYDIAYASSHPVSAVITKITKPNYSKATAATVTIYNQSDGATTVTPASTISGNKESFTVSIVDGKVRLSHVLNNNNTSDGFDYVPYDITVVVTNEADMSQTITYKQYPEMYISVTLNTDYNNGGGNNDDKGFAWVNNSRTTLGDLDGFGAGSNSNPNMITITTTALGADSDYIVGDPRVSTINNLNYNNWANVKDINGTTRQLLYYYPTDTSTAASNMISPQFRIASSYGVTSGISFDNAQRRCASYQEDGYPAGRWRVPTTAELKYIVQLSAKGYITILFNNGGDYWAADKKIWVPNSSSGTVTQGSGSSAYVRCVYDDWYWGSERLTTPGATTLTSFTWGDMPR